MHLSFAHRERSTQTYIKRLKIDRETVRVIAVVISCLHNAVDRQLIQDLGPDLAGRDAARRAARQQPGVLGGGGPPLELSRAQDGQRVRRARELLPLHHASGARGASHLVVGGGLRHEGVDVEPVLVPRAGRAAWLELGLGLG